MDFGDWALLIVSVLVIGGAFAVLLVALDSMRRALRVKVTRLAPRRVLSL